MRRRFIPSNHDLAGLTLLRSRNAATESGNAVIKTVLGERFPGANRPNSWLTKHGGTNDLCEGTSPFSNRV
jgi:hypothetical protein